MTSPLSEKIANGLVYYLGFLLAITFYQATVAYVARARGDTSHTTRERASFVPFVHMELLGTVIFPLLTIIAGSPVVFGWPKPFNISTRYLKKPRRDINIIYSCGLGVIFLVALACMITLRFMGGSAMSVVTSGTFLNTAYIAQTLLTVVGMVCMNIGALFLLPMPGTAGWNLLLNNVSYNLSQKLIQSSFIISMVTLVLILSGILNFYFRFFIFLFFAGSTF